MKAARVFLLASLTLGMLAAGAWGIFTVGAHAEPAAVGEAVEVPGGLLRVERAAAEEMASMHKGKFASSGMNMSGTGMDMAPKGQRRFSVEVALAAEGSDLSYSPGDFTVAGEGMEPAGPVRSQLGEGTVPAGSEVSGTLVFQAPEEARDLRLGFRGGDAPVALDVDGGSSPAEDHHSEEPAAAGGHHGPGEGDEPHEH